MSDFVSGFWNIYVAAITGVSILACAVFLWQQSRVKRSVVVGKSVETMGHVWDENLEEFNNPLPRWWMWLFYITLLFAVVYLIVYPGFGSFQGTFNWSSTGQYDKEIANANAQYGPIFEKFAKQDLKAVAADGEVRQMGERLFLTYCSQCHGSDARGAKGFPNLSDSDWLYGGEPETIKTTIMEGRNGVMPPFAQLGAETVKDVANYVRSLSGLAVDSIRVQRGKDAFQQNCVACHGPDGKGMAALGAPNLMDTVWLYGSSEAVIGETITKGRNNQMPKFKDFLGEAKVHLLAAYVYGLAADKAKPAAAK